MLDMDRFSWLCLLVLVLPAMVSASPGNDPGDAAGGAHYCGVVLSQTSLPSPPLQINHEFSRVEVEGWDEWKEGNADDEAMIAKEVLRDPLHKFLHPLHCRFVIVVGGCDCCERATRARV